MPTQPLVSVIVPVYNAAGYLERCIESILRQTWQNFELILVDDGSTDESGQICDRYALKDNRVRVFHKENGGVSSARNYGLLMIRGGYLTFVDSDDWIAPAHLQNFMSKADGYDWVMQGMKYIDEKGQVQQVRGVSKEISAVSTLEMDKITTSLPQFCWITNKLYKSSLVKGHCLRFLKESHIHEDRIFNLEYMQYASSMVMLSTSTYNYAYNPNSLTRHKYVNPYMFLYTANAFDHILGKHKLGLTTRTYTASFCFRFYIHTIGCCLIYPLGVFPLKKRVVLFYKTLKTLFVSATLHEFKFKIPKWLIYDILYFIRRLF